MPDIFDNLPAASAPAGGTDIFDRLPATAPAATPAAPTPAAPAPKQGGGFFTDLVRSWKEASGTIGQTLFRPPTTSYAGVPPIPPGAPGGETAANPPNIERTQDVIAAGRAPIYDAAKATRLDAAEENPLDPAYAQSGLHAVTSSAVKALPAVAASALNPAAGVALGSAYFSQDMRNLAEDSGHPEAAEKMAAAGAGLGVLSAIPLGTIAAQLKVGNPFILAAMKSMTANLGERTLEPVIASSLGKSVAVGALKGAAANAVGAGVQTVGSNVATREFGVDPNRSPLEGLGSALASGGILGLIFGGMAGAKGYTTEAKAWESLTGAYASEFPNNPEVRDAVQAYGDKRTPENLAKVVGAANRAAEQLPPDELAGVIERLQKKFGIDTGGPVVNERADQGTPGTPAEDSGAIVPMQTGARTTIFGAKGTQFPATYAFAPTSQIQTSHEGEMMAKNPDYALENTRDYSDAAERDKQLDVLANFDPRRHVTDAPDASVGPSIVGTVIDENGQSSLQRFGGNNRGYAIANLAPEDRAQLNALQNAKAGQFGLAPTNAPDAELVRHIGTFDFRQPGERDRAQAIVDQLNPSPGMIQGTAKRAQIDAGSVPPDLLAQVPMDIAPADAQDFVNGLIGHGLVDRNTTAAIAAAPAQAQDYVQRLLVQSAFRQPGVAEARNDPRASAGTVRGMIDAATPALVQMRALPQGNGVADAVSRAFTTTLGYLRRPGATLPDALDAAARQHELDPEHAVAQEIAAAMKAGLVLDKTGRVRPEPTVANWQQLFGRIHGALRQFNPEPNLFGETESIAGTVRRALAMPGSQAPAATEALGMPASGAAVHPDQAALDDPNASKLDLVKLANKYGMPESEIRERWQASREVLIEGIRARMQPQPKSGAAPTKTKTPARKPVAANKVRAAYAQLVSQDPWGFPHQPISEIQKLSGVPMDDLKEWISNERAAGRADLAAGDWSLSSPEKRAGAINVGEEKMLLVRLRANHDAAALGRGGTPLSAQNKLPMSPTGRDAGVSIPQVLGSYEAIARAIGGNTPIRFGRFIQRALGIYKPGSKVARIANAGDLSTAAHEIAHALQHAAFGDYNSGVLNRTLPPQAAVELHRLGQLLYGSKMPSNGYESEGWAEFWRLYLTTDDAQAEAPNMYRWAQQEFLAKRPKVATAMAAAKNLTDAWRAQGALARARNQMVKPPGALARLGRAISSTFTKANWIEEFQPLKELADEAQRLTGKRLTESANPYEVASARRGSAGAVTLQMVLHGMIDLQGNLATDAQGRTVGSLKSIVQPLRGLEDEFSYYLWARRALELHARNQDPGMTAEDAAQIIDELGNAHPEMGPAADQLYEWQKHALLYLAEANPAMAPSILRMIQANQSYVPLQRMIETAGKSAGARTVGGGAGGSSLTRFKGSGRPVKALFDQIISNTQRWVAMAHKAQVLQAVVGLARVPGLGHLIEEVPQERVKESVSVDAIRQQLEDAGIDTSSLAPGQMLDFWTVADRPKGTDAIVPVRRGGGVTWYQVAPELYDVLSGLEPARMGPIANYLGGIWARGFRLATTGIRPSFQLVTLPARQIPMLLTQTMSSSNPAYVLYHYLAGMRDAIMGGVLKQHNPWYDTFNRLGLEGGQFLGPDSQFTRRTASGLFRGMIRHTVADPIEAFRAFISFMDRPPRIAEMRMTAERIGWAPGTPMTPDQAIALANAGKRGGAVDYSAGGTLAKQMNQVIPFFNPAIQHGRTMARAFQQRPWVTLLRMLAYSVLPGLGLWLANRDKKWYQDLPWRERYVYNNFSPDGRNVIQIPRPQEWSIFPALLEGALDSWYRRDPAALREAASYSVAANTPDLMPVLARAAWEQGTNKTSFFNRPIVPKTQLDLPPGDQFAPYTSELAKALGRAFPENVSPRRVDALVRGVFAGTGSDALAATDALVHALGLTPAQPTLQREWEASDLPILGRIFRHGGTETGNNQTIGDFWDKYLELTSKQHSKTAPLTPAEMVWYLGSLKPAAASLKVSEGVATAATRLDQRQAIYGAMSAMARTALAAAPKQ